MPRDTAFDQAVALHRQGNVDGAERLYERFLALLAEQGLPPQRGVFGAYMQVEIHNDGPVTLMVESPA